MAAVWNALTAVIATVVGLAPHVLRGPATSRLFGAVGLLLSTAKIATATAGGDTVVTGGMA